jgi:hypothetical protein
MIPLEHIIQWFHYYFGYDYLIISEKIQYANEHHEQLMIILSEREREKEEEVKNLDLSIKLISLLLLFSSISSYETSRYIHIDISYMIVKLI